MTTKIKFEYALGDIIKNIDIDKWAVVVKIDKYGYWLKYLDTSNEHHSYFAIAHKSYKRVNV